MPLKQRCSHCSGALTDTNKAAFPAEFTSHIFNRWIIAMEKYPKRSTGVGINTQYRGAIVFINLQALTKVSTPFDGKVTSCRSLTSIKEKSV